MAKTLPKQLSAREQRRRILARLERSGANLSEFTTAKAEYPPAEYDDLVRSIFGRPPVTKALFPAFAIPKIEQLQRYIAPEPVSLAREIAWAASVLSTKISHITQLTTAQDEFLRAYLVRSPNALTILDSLDAQIGATLWSACARTAALQAIKGLEAQKAYTRELRSGAPRANVAAYILYQTSVRNEPTVTWRRFVSDIRIRLRAAHAPNTTLFHVLHYYILGAIPTERTELARLLSSGSNGAAGDYYLLFLDVCRMIAAQGYPESDNCLQALGRLASVPDHEISALTFALLAATGRAHDGRSLGPPDLQVALEAMGKCLSDDAPGLQNVSEAYQDHSSRAEWLELGARSVSSDADGINPPISVAVASHLAQVISRTGNPEEARDFLTKLSINVQCGGWSAALAAYADFTTSNVIEAPQSPITCLAAPFLPPPVPWFLPFSMPSRRGNYASAATAAAGDGPGSWVTHYFEAVADPAQREPIPSVHLGEPQAAIAKGRTAYREQDYVAAVDAVRPALASGDRITRSQAVQLTAWSLLDAAQLGQCVRFVSAELLAQPALAGVCPVSRLASALSPDQRAKLAGDLSLPVFFDFAVRTVGARFDVARRDAFEDYLTSWRVDRPSDLPDEAVSGAEGVYYLRYVCVPAVLETSAADYQSEDAVAEERVRICTRLTKLDPTNAKEYEEEIKRLVRELTVGRRVRELDQTKIYVDVDGLRRVAKESLREAYRRYIEFRRHGLVNEQQNPTELEEAFEKMRAGDTSALNSLTLPEDEPVSLLAMMVQEIARLYFVDPTYGLDRFLSARIRHGTLSGQLRTPLATAMLVTPRDEVTNTYQRNTYWPRVLGLESRPEGLELAERLAEFARDVDEFIENKLRPSFAATPHDANAPGLFRYDVSPGFVRLFAASITGTLTFEEFLDTILASMRNALEEMLPNVRAEVSHGAQAKFAELFLGLQKDTRRICEIAGVSPDPIESAISSARTEIQHSIERVADWLYMSPSASLEPFTIELATEVATRSVKALYPDFSAAIETVGTPAEWTGQSARLLPTVVDALFPPLQNAAKHSPPHPPEKARVRLEHVGDETRVLVRSTLRPDTVLADLLDDVATRKAAMTANSYGGAAAGEGGSGLFKLYSTLVSLSERPELEFGVDTATKQYYVNFLLRPIADV